MSEPRTIVIVRSVRDVGAVRDAARRLGERLGPSDRLWATTEVPPRLTLVPFRRTPVLVASLGGTDAERGATFERLEACEGALEAWDVETTTPVVGGAAPAAVLLTLFRKRSDLDAATFRRRWFEEHTPLTIEVHPVIGYVRHAVQRRRRGRVDWDGIVTEDFAAPAHLTSMGLFGQGLFGRGPSAALNAVRIARHIGTFLELSTIETYLVHPIAIAQATPPR